MSYRSGMTGHGYFSNFWDSIFAGFSVSFADAANWRLEFLLQ